MNYTLILHEAWETIWKNKFMILLGVLAALANTGGGGNGQGIVSWEGDPASPPRFDFPALFQDPGFPELGAGLVVLLVGLAVLLAAALWVAGTMAHGGLISGADSISSGQTSSFQEAFQAGWQKGWRLIGINLIPLLPILLLVVVSLAGLGLFQGTRIISEGEFSRITNAAAAAPFIVIGLLLGLTSLVLTLIRNFANRACMLEDLGVVAAYRRGAEVLTANFGPAIVLFVLQIVISVALGLVLFFPGMLVALCCVLWPLLLIGQGLYTAYYSTLWTLAWNRWTESPVILEGSGTAG